MSTTAGGDGLEFDTRLLSIFDEVQQIKTDKKDKRPKIFTKNDDEGLNLEQVAALENINPRTILVQSISNLEALRTEI